MFVNKDAHNPLHVFSVILQTTSVYLLSKVCQLNFSLSFSLWKGFSSFYLTNCFQFCQLYLPWICQCFQCIPAFISGIFRFWFLIFFKTISGNKMFIFCTWKPWYVHIHCLITLITKMFHGVIFISLGTYLFIAYRLLWIFWGHIKFQCEMENDVKKPERRAVHRP